MGLTKYNTHLKTDLGAKLDSRFICLGLQDEHFYCEMHL